MYLGSNGVIAPDYSQVPTQGPAIANGDVVVFAALVGPGGVLSARQRLISTLNIIAARAAVGFGPFPAAIIVDEDTGGRVLTVELQLVGYNALSVRDIFPPAIEGPVMNRFAYGIRGRVLTHEWYDYPDQDERSPPTGLVVPDRVKSAVGIVRYISQLYGVYP